MGFGSQYGAGAFGGSSEPPLATFFGSSFASAFAVVEIPASATFSGGSTASSTAAVRLLASATFTGSSAFTAQAGSNQLSTAFFQGSSTFEWDYIGDAAATFLGTSSASASAVAARVAAAFFQGSSSFLYGQLLPIQGDSFFSIAPFVDVQLRPLRAITLGPKTFRWLQTLQRGDLPIFISDGRNAVGPVRVVYRLAQIRLDGTRKYVGPQERVPVAGVLGEFYASGRAGESGQPGQWIIEWSFQQTFQSAVQKAEMQFQVLDAVAIGDPREQLDRKIKFGWS